MFLLRSLGENVQRMWIEGKKPFTMERVLGLIRFTFKKWEGKWFPGF